jgi:hypothetical protein
MFSQKVTELIKHRGDKGRTYNVIPLDWGINNYDTMQYYINTWYGHWRSYGNKQDWLMYNGPIIKPDPAKINKGRTSKIRIPMVMDE